nr:CRISPR-associated endonuclease Cas3'' [Polymorphobacter sp.]
MTIYAHSVPGDNSCQSWEILADHLAEVGALASINSGAFGSAPFGIAVGRLHDIGKCSEKFQDYIKGLGPSPDHSTAGAIVATELYGPKLGRLLAFTIAGHHAGLADGADSLARRLADLGRVPDYRDWRAHIADLPGPADLVSSTTHLKPSPEPGFAFAFFTRMLFSALVDADFIATERFYAHAEGKTKVRGGHRPLADLRDRLHAAMAVARDDTPVNRLRAEVLDHAIARAELAPGLFTLTVPTGGGKTLASLSFALEHAVRHGLRRVVYVIPYTSIIEQTAGVFRAALGSDDDILEHHANFEWDRSGTDAEGRDGADKLRRLAENWDVPIVVTTAVQFFESLFAARTSRCRKLHNLAGTVIVLDEAQTLPIALLRPCLAAIDELARNYGSSVVLCTATQPALRRTDDALPKAWALAIDDTRELAPDPRDLYDRLRRVTVERLAEPVVDAVIAARFAETPQMLCIVNSRKHARELFETIRDQPGSRHLTTLMCAAHRQTVLAAVRAGLAAREPVRVVATSLIEAGVDVDFPEVWRAMAGLDSIAQAAGRCNREGRLDAGRVVVFDPADNPAPRAFAAMTAATRAIFRRHHDLLGLDAVTEYFRELYFAHGADRLDAARLDGEVYPIMRNIGDTANRFDFPFASIARAFRMIDEAMVPVLVPYDDKARALLARLTHAEKPPIDVLRGLQRYTVPVPDKVRRALIDAGNAAAIGSAAKDGSPFVALLNEELYDFMVGLKLDDPGFRSPEQNIFS